MPPTAEIFEDAEFYLADDEALRFMAIDSIRMDSALNYVGEVPGLMDSCGFKPHHVCNGLGNYTLGVTREYNSIEGRVNLLVLYSGTMPFMHSHRSSSPRICFYAEGVSGGTCARRPLDTPLCSDLLASVL